jgi:hypothetical protein
LERITPNAKLEEVTQMAEFTIGDTALFKVDDTEDPALARVRLLSLNTQLSHLLPWKVWKVVVLEVVKPSTARMKSQVKIGARKEVAEKQLIAA